MQDTSNTNEIKEQKRRGRGRPKGSKSRRRRPREVLVAAYEKTGEMPLDYMLRVMRDKRQKTQRRDFMAVRAAPYCHHALATIKQQPGLPLEQLLAGMTADELATFKGLFGTVVARLQPAGRVIEHHAGGSPPTE